MALFQPLNSTGNRRTFAGEGGDEGRPEAMPAEDAHTNKTYVGRSGVLKASRPLRLGGNANQIRNQSISAVQKSRKRK
jgi:hypothetical protein